MLGKILNNPFHNGNYKLLVEIKIHDGLQSLKWKINKLTCDRILKIFNRLPPHIKGIPNLDDSRAYKCCIYYETEAFMLAFNDLVIGFKGNIIEVKMDCLDVFKNEILKTCPADLYRVVINLLSDFKTEEDIVSSSVDIMNKTGKLKTKNCKT